METKICRTCGGLGQSYVDIFRTEGLKNKIETCLPIIVSPHILLPDTICVKCQENVESFFSFIKKCLHNIIVLESQYDVHESCLKSKRRKEKSCTADLSLVREEKGSQADFLDIFKVTGEVEGGVFFVPEVGNPGKSHGLVDYDVESVNSSEGDNDDGRVEIPSKKLEIDDINRYIENVLAKTDCSNKKTYFDDEENQLINEIEQRKGRKRKWEVIETQPTKIFKMDRRKSNKPKKLEQKQQENSDLLLLNLPQICLLCDNRFEGAAALAAHVFELHGIDMAEVVGGATNGGAGGVATDSNERCCSDSEKKKKIPNLVKISDLKREVQDDNQTSQDQTEEQPPTLLPSFVCPMCPAVLTTKSDLFAHLRVKHLESTSLMCGMCLQQTSTHLNLRSHVETCAQNHNFTSPYLCQICFFGDDDVNLMRKHVGVHHFLGEICSKQDVTFDAMDYIKQGPGKPNMFFCEYCRTDSFESFKEFSAHRRLAHSIFHCDLCTKLYGRNSHLWKHVNRLHKGHESVTCQLCFKTSASEYHLQQHLNKIHSANKVKDDFMSQKFQAFDFQSVKQSFMKQELIEQQKLHNQNATDSSDDDEDDKNNLLDAPKEIDSSSNLYTNIITNYTPPVNIGDHKCNKCGKNFQKKPMLKKHKKNCRPRPQKDLLTRCKSCARVFKDRQSLTKHLDNYHSEYSCEICHVQVQSKCEIVSHIRFSHPKCHLICKICGNILRSKEDLNKHVQNHGESFICQFCADSIPSKIKLKMHVLSLHRKILSLSCGVCLKLFETQHILRDHVKLVHKDQLSPLTSCTVCGKNYGSKWKTFDHLNKSHGKIFKACRICLEVFNNEEELILHGETVHQNGSLKSLSRIKSENHEKKKNDEDEAQNDTEDEEEEYETQDEPEEEDDVKYVLTNDLKISLLEKRLVGKKLTEEDTKPLSKRAKKTPKKEPKIADEDTSYLNTSNTLQNSSKRTVYVNSNDPSYCEICFKNWPAKKHLWQHYIRCHKAVAATVCGICLKTNDNYKTLQVHLQENHPTLLHGQGFGSNFICRICGRYHNASSKLRLHMAIHENFDWGILSEENDKKNEIKTENKRREANGYGYDYENDEDIELEMKYENDINYEDDIEQVELSETEVVDDEEEEEDVDVIKREIDEEDEEEATSVSSENSSEKSLKTTMLQNMLQENQKRVPRENGSDSDATEDEYREKISESDDEEDSGDSTESTQKYCIKSISNSDTGDSSSRPGNAGAVATFRGYEPEELDSAIKSISYDENELASAVGSIL
ncbi:unnamed protein product [Brassicogethes aeneus]|uniref:Uncharacterized protein n=1 Tax=Brassicogethes aeneus TaxID=1431903 RepID=A0A9P0ATT0_BRAAE|nr:unnamed protein product [Brassicogethes aeneus]